VCSVYDRQHSTIAIYSCNGNVKLEDRKHSLISNAILNDIIIVSQMCINIRVIVISVKNALIDPVTLTFDLQPKTMSLLGYPKVIPYIEFVIIRF